MKYSLLLLSLIREYWLWVLTWRAFRMQFSWMWFQTVGPNELTPPCQAWLCGSQTCWPGSRSLRPGPLILCYSLQCGWLASLTPSLSSQPSCRRWPEGRPGLYSNIRHDKINLLWWSKPLCFLFKRNEWPLDSMSLQCDVTKKTREEFSSLPREGAYIHGMYMEGARWDTQVHKRVMSVYCVRKYYILEPDQYIDGDQYFRSV